MILNSDSRVILVDIQKDFDPRARLRRRRRRDRSSVNRLLRDYPGNTPQDGHPEIKSQ